MRSFPFPKILLALLPVVLSIGCKGNPIERLVNPFGSGVVPQNTAPYVIYDEEIKTGGGAGFIPSDGNQSLVFDDRSSPRRSVFATRYTWTGGDVYNPEASPPAFQHLFAGFSFLVSPDFATLSSYAGRNLFDAGYTKLTLHLRANLSPNTVVRIEGPDDGPGGHTTVSADYTAADLIASDWNYIQLSVPSTHFSNVKVFATVSLQYQQPGGTTTPGAGGTIYLDDVRYEQ